MDLIYLFGKNVKKYRVLLGVSQEKFAEMAGLHRTYISDIERYKRNVSLENIQKIADVIGVEPYQLLKDCEDNE